MKTLSRRRPAWAVFLLAGVCLCATAALPGAVAERGPLRRAPPTAPAETEARVIVKYKAESPMMRALSATGSAAPPQHAQAMSARLGLSLTDGRPIGDRAQVMKASGLSSQALAERLAAQGDVEYAVVDERKFALAAPNDPFYQGNLTSATPAAGQWYLRAPTSATITGPTSVVSAINAEAAWDVTRGSSAVVVAVLDTGVRRDHPDLTAKLLPGYDFVGGSGSAAAIALANDGDGRDADPSDPGDSITAAEANQVDGQFYHCGDQNPPGVFIGQNSSWHGTQTSGLVGAATDNGIGMASAGRNVTVLPVRVLGKCGGYDSDIQAAMLWSAGLAAAPPISSTNRARVINLSLGSPVVCAASYKDVVAQLNAAGVVVVAAAGNEGVSVGSPASCPGVIAVAGVRHAGTKVGYSDLGPEIAIASPAGNCVNSSGTCLFPLLTTSNKGTTTPIADTAGGSIYTGDGGDASLGTSFSAPLVAGTVGLMLSVNPVLKPAQVLRALQSTARAFPSTGAAASVAACVAPTATAQIECYCTTSTCGAGLADAGAAALAASAINAQIAASAASATVGSSVELDGSGSWPSGGTSGISTYQWAITGGATLASLTSSTSPKASLLTTAAGNVEVTLTVTDTAGQKGTRSVALTVTPPQATVQSSSDGGGGGALSVGWLFGLLAAVAGVRVVTPRPRA